MTTWRLDEQAKIIGGLFVGEFDRVDVRIDHCTRHPSVDGISGTVEVERAGRVVRTDFSVSWHAPAMADGSGPVSAAFFEAVHHAIARLEQRLPKCGHEDCAEHPELAAVCEGFPPLDLAWPADADS